MTTGTDGDRSFFGYGPGGFYKSWAGTDGKTEVVDGRIRAKWNDYTMRRESYYQLPSHHPTYPPGGDYFFNIDSLSVFDAYWDNSDQVSLEAKLVSKIRGHDFNLAVNVAQGRQLVDMVVGNLRKFRTAIRSLKRGDFATAARSLGAKPRQSKLSAKDISGRWLELQYGWLPSLSDTYEAAKAFEALTLYRSFRVVVSKKKLLHPEFSQSPSNYSCLADLMVGRKIIAEISEDLSNPRSLGLYDPLSVIWEVIPYSFVVDWFIPIGTYLDNLSILPNLKGRFLTTSLIKANAFVDSTFVEDPDFVPGQARYRATILKRQFDLEYVATFPRPVSFPSAMSPKRIWNAIALSHQAFR